MLSVEKMLIISAFKGFQAENVIVYVAGGKSGNVTSVGWQETLCDPTWNVSSSGAEAIANCYTPFALFGWGMEVTRIRGPGLRLAADRREREISLSSVDMIILY